jgi:hypothetical protein
MGVIRGRARILDLAHKWHAYENGIVRPGHDSGS